MSKAPCINSVECLAFSIVSNISRFEFYGEGALEHLKKRLSRIFAIHGTNQFI